MSFDHASLRAALSPEARVSVSEGEKALYSRDCWPYLNLMARAGDHSLRPPDAVVFPATEADVVETVRWCLDHRVPIVPVGGASGVAGATVPVQGGVALDVKRLELLDDSLAVSSGLIRAGAGWIGARLEHELNRRGLTLGHFPSSILCSTLGGYVATRSAGQLSSRHGKIEDMVVGVRYVDHQGEIRQTFADGWDCTQLIIGSEGTLGVILDAWVRVEPAPEHRRYRGFACPSVGAALEVMREIMQAGLRPSVVRLYDEFDTFISGARKAGEKDDMASSGLVKRLGEWVAGRVDPVDARQKTLSAANALLGRSFGSPLVLNALADRAYDECLLILGVEESTAEAADAHAEDVFAIAAGALKDLGPKPGEHWYKNRYSVSYKMSPLVQAGLFVDTMEVATTWSNLEHLYASVKRGLGEHVFVMAHFSHVYVDGCSIYFTFAGFGADDATCLRRYIRTWNAAMRTVVEAGGSLTHHHGIGLMKAPRLDDDHRGGRPLFDDLKQALDPNNVFNPGKLWHTEEAWL